jgi:hypothetical protein
MTGTDSAIGLLDTYRVNKKNEKFLRNPDKNEVQLQASWNLKVKGDMLT